MSPPRYTAMQKFSHRIASNLVISRFFARVMPPWDRFVFRLTGGRTSATALMTGLKVINLTAIGAKSGQPRTVPLLGIEDEQNPSTYIVLASNWGQAQYPSWYFNVKAHPNVTCLVDGQRKEYAAREVSGAEYERCWAYAAQAYLGFAVYKVRAANRRIPIMILEPVS